MSSILFLKRLLSPLTLVYAQTGFRPCFWQGHLSCGSQCLRNKNENRFK